MTGRVGGRPSPLSYRGLDELGADPHVMVDGAARPGSTLVLSHWPGSPTPPGLWRDLSAEIALAYLEQWRDFETEAECVSLDHLDEDGLAALFTLVDPETATRIAEPLVAFARAGDFATGDRSTCRAVFSFMTLSSPATSPYRTEVDHRARFETLATHRLLESFVELVTEPERFEWAWSEQDAALEASFDALARGDISIEEREEVALAVVRIGSPDLSAAGPDDSTPNAMHRFVIHSSTDMPRVLVLWDRGALYYDRYETWVRFISRRLPMRVDLVPLARRLERAERAGQRWRAGSPGATLPTLSTDAGAPTTLGSEEIEDLVVTYLAEAPAAWDPFATGSPLIATR